MWIIVSAILAGLSVALGAFAAHGLQGQLSSSSLDAFKTGVHYQFMHALAILAIGIWTLHESSQPVQGWLTASMIAWLIGVILFSGSLYGLTLAGWRWLGPVTPLGGLSFLTGWIILAVVAWRVNGS